MIPSDVPDGPLLVDTDVISYWVAQAVQGEAFSALVAGHDQAISFATYGELLAHPYRAKWGDKRLREYRHRLRSFVIVPYSAAVTELWARMHARLGGHLHKGGTNDLWTAACSLAVAPRLPIVTNNLNDFTTIAKEFPEIRLVHPDL